MCILRNNNKIECIGKINFRNIKKLKLQMSSHIKISSNRSKISFYKDKELNPLRCGILLVIHLKTYSVIKGNHYIIAQIIHYSCVYNKHLREK